MAKEIISEFKEKPKIKTVRRVIGLSLVVVFSSPILGIYAAVIRPMIDRASSEKVGAAVGFGLVIVILVMLITALALGVRAIKRGERSRVLRLGFALAILTIAFWIFMIIGEFLFPH